MLYIKEAHIINSNESFIGDIYIEDGKIKNISLPN